MDRNLKHAGSDPVHVLLSTYNGEKYLAAQLDSILAQTYPNILLVIRDDGSSDSTPAILQEYAERHANVTVVFGVNLGAIASFMDLLRRQVHAGGYFAFCDQDDIWHRDKIDRAVSALKSSTQPERALYFSRLALVNQDGAQIQLSDVPMHLSFNNALVENVVTGASAVFGSGIRDLMLMGRPECMVWHDWWLYLVATALGQVIYDEVPSIQFRRHGNTQTNLRVRSLEGVAQKMRAFIRIARRKRKVHPFAQAACFGEVYRPLLDQRQLLLIAKIGKLRERRLLDRARFLFDRDFILNDRLDDLGLRLLVLLGRA
jgi:glycosyltransferase involved in cell wall biosynthesis